MSRILSIQGFQYSEDLYFNGFPSSVSLEVTNRCNLKCTHCSHTYRSNMLTGDIQEGVFEKIGPHLGREIRSISLNGLGEPLLYKKWDSVLNTCLDVDNLTVGFITNGIIPLTLTDTLFTSSVNITYSIDGASAAVYKIIRQADVFDRVISNIRDIDELKKRKNSDGPVLNANFVITAQNIHEMADFIRLAHMIGLSNVSFTQLVAHGESQLIKDSAFFRQNDHDRFLQEALQEGERLGIHIIHMGTFNTLLTVSDRPETAWLYRNDSGTIECGMIKNWCMINYTGHVQVCCAPESLIAGDLRENSLLEIWNGAVYRKLKTGLSHSFEKTCGDMCNLRQTISLDDIRSFFCGIHETYTYDPGQAITQPYNISDLNRMYSDAVISLQNGNSGSVAGMCDEILTIEPLAFEAENVKGIALSLLGKKEEAAKCFLRSYGISRDYDAAAVNIKNLSGTQDN